MQITLGLQHELQLHVTMAATDASLFYLYFSHLISSLCNDNDDGSSGVVTLSVAGEKDMGEAGTISTVASRCCLVNWGVRIIKFWSASFHGVWLKIHIHSPWQYVILSLQKVRNWMFPYTHSTNLYGTMWVIRGTIRVWISLWRPVTTFRTAIIISWTVIWRM